MMLAERPSRRVRYVGIATIAVAAVGVVVALSAHRAIPFRSYTYVTAAFDDVVALRRGDDVRVAGVRVGQVHDVRYEDEQAIVEMQLPGSYEVHADATASIAARNAFGQRFVQLRPGSPSAGRAGHIPIDRTTSPVELDELLSELDEPTRDALASTIRELGGGVAGHGVDLNDTLAAAPEFLDDLGLLAGELTEDDAELVALLSAADTLAGRFEGRTDDLAALVPDAADTLAALAADEGRPVGDALATAPGMLRELRPAIDRLGAAAADTRVAVEEASPGLRALGDVSGDLRSLLMESVPTLGSVPGVAGDALPAIDALDATMVDLRPLAPDVRRALQLARSPVVTLAPYSPDIGAWFDRARAATGHGDGTGNWLRLVPVFGPGTAVPPVPPCRNPYPAPGESIYDRQVILDCGR